MEAINILINWVLVYIIILGGLFGNLISLFIFSMDSFAKFPARTIYFSITISDSFYLIFWLISITSENFQINFSRLACQFYFYFQYLISSISIWLLVHLSIDRFLTITYPKISIVKKRVFQYLIIGTIVLFNIVINVPNFILIAWELKNETNKSFCDLDKSYYSILVWIEVFIFSVTPFLLMIIFSILLIRSIFQSRMRILRQANQQVKNRFKKDVKFAFNCIFLNVIFLITNLPISILDFFDYLYGTLFYRVVLLLMCFGYSINFYLLVCFNSLFRKQILKFFRKKSN